MSHKRPFYHIVECCTNCSYSDDGVSECNKNNDPEKISPFGKCDLYEIDYLKLELLDE